MLVFFINPIGASEIDLGRIEFNPGANPSDKSLESIFIKAEKGGVAWARGGVEKE